jgi:DNA-binding transcriptional MerR regulator
MAQYSIEQFSKITGFSKLLIRTWENRYNLFVPGRSSTNIRFYSDATLVKGLNIVILREKGLKISKISMMNDYEIESLVRDISKEEGSAYFTKQLNKVIEAGLTFNSDLFNRTIDDSFTKFGTLYVYVNILLPAMTRIGYLWLTKEILPSQEHFLSELIKQKLYSHIGNVNISINDNIENWVLFLPEGEHHEIGLLVAHLLLLEKSHRVIYLGQSVPVDSLKIINDFHEVNNILFFAVTRSSVQEKDKIIFNLRQHFKNQKIFCVTKQNIPDFKSDKNLQIINSIDQFKSIIA